METAMFFFFNDTATTEIYTLSLHDALPIYAERRRRGRARAARQSRAARHSRVHSERREEREGDGADLSGERSRRRQDRKSTRLNSSHANISYAVFCLKKKNNNYKSIYLH